jgi:hypothetical protein
MLRKAALRATAIALCAPVLLADARLLCAARRAAWSTFAPV